MLSPEQMNTEAAAPLKATHRRLPPILVEGGLAGIPLATSLAMIALESFNAEAVPVLVFLLFFSSISALITRMRRGITLGKLASLTFIAGFVFWYSYPAFISHFLPDYALDQNVYVFIDPETIIWSVAYLSLFLLCGLISSLFFSSSHPSPIPNGTTYPRANGSRIIGLSLVGCFLGISSYLALGGSISTIISGIIESRAIEKPWLQAENLGNVISAFTYVTSSAMVSGACLLWAATLDKSVSKLARLVVWVVAFVITITIYFDHGTRSIFALVFLPYVTMLISVLWQRSRLYSVVVCLIVLTVVIVALQFQMLYRADYTRSEIYNLLFQEWFTLGGTIDYFKETLFAVRLVPEDHDFFKESVFVQFLVSPIPRFIWPEKPATELVWFYTMSRWNVDIYMQGGTALPGIVGQYYMSWGWIGPMMIGGLFGWLTARLDSFLSKVEANSDPYTSALGIMLVVWIFISYRLLSPGFFYPVMASALIVLLSRKIGGRRETRDVI